MQIPLSYADAIIGSAGANISYMRRTSGATITIQETRSVPGEMTVEIHGSASQVQTAQQLIQVHSRPLSFPCLNSWNHFFISMVLDTSFQPLRKRLFENRSVNLSKMTNVRRIILHQL